jgi:putative hydrolase of the HAD superfamily
VAKTYGTDDLMEPLDTPLVDAAQWAKQVQQVLHDDFATTADLAGFAEKWFSGRPPNHQLIECLGQVRARGHFVGMLSNMIPAFEPYWPALVDPQLFDALVFSYKVGVRKPQRAIFDLAAERSGTAARDCILIDDLPVNCNGARAAGWLTVLHAGGDDTMNQLEGLLARKL